MKQHITNGRKHRPHVPEDADPLPQATVRIVLRTERCAGDVAVLVWVARGYVRDGKGEWRLMYGCMAEVEKKAIYLARRWAAEVLES